MLARKLRTPAGENALVLAILACGALLRLVWVARAQNLKPYFSESHHIATSLVRSGTFADPFGVATGATAHVGMLTPLTSAAAYWLFGVDTRAAEFMLSAWATFILLLGLWLFWRLACELGAPRISRLAAIAFAAMVPLQFKLELQEGRNWEVNFAVMMLFWILLRLVMADKKDKASPRELLLLGAVTGFLFIVSPPAGLAAILAMAFFQYRKLRIGQWWIAPLAAALIAGLLGGFWAERNLAALGAPIALRDNFGLELALSNYDGVDGPADPFAAYLARLREIHPMHSENAREALKAAGGEVAYYHQLGEAASGWILAHPALFVQLSADRFAQFYLPPKWFWSVYGRFGTTAWLQQALSWIAALMGAGSLLVLACRRRGYAYLLIAALVCSAPYVIIQPTLRYRYLVSTLLIFVAFDGAGRLAAYLATRKGAARTIADASAR